MIYSMSLVLIFAICLLYFYIFKYKGEQLMKLIGIVIGISGVLTAIALILENKYYFMKSRIRNLVGPPIFILLAIMFILITLYALKMRKNPERKLAAYFWLATVVFSIILVFVVFILLPKFGI